MLVGRGMTRLRTKAIKEVDSNPDHSTKIRPIECKLLDWTKGEFEIRAPLNGKAVSRVSFHVRHARHLERASQL